MRGLTCFRIGALLARRAAGLTESERLEVESHHAECRHCQAEARALSAVRTLAADAPVLSPQARELVLRRAFDLTLPGRAASDPDLARTPKWRWGGAALAFAVAALLLLGLARGRNWFAPTAKDHVAAGSVSLPDRELAINAEIPANTELSSATGAHLAVGHAEVDAEPGTRVLWRASEANLVLHSGAVHVVVEHVPHEHFRVTTDTFIVEVVGTRFQVSPQGVRVSRGVVRVLSLDGREVLAVLPAGGSWSAPVPVPVPALAPVLALDTPAPDAAHDAPPSSSAKDAEASVSVAQWLSDARHALAAHRVAEAQRAADAALRLHPSALEVAEARTLLAECAGASGDAERAVRLYLSVAHQFPSLPAAENALFAAARTRDRSGQAAQAQALFESYLKRYPVGRFRAEAERHVARLESAAHGE